MRAAGPGGGGARAPARAGAGAGWQGARARARRAWNGRARLLTVVPPPISGPGGLGWRLKERVRPVFHLGSEERNSFPWR